MKIANPLGLVFAFSDRGAVRTIEVGPMRIGIRPPSAFSRSGANLYLRTRGSRIAYTPLLGPESPSRFRVADGVFEARGSWAGLEYACVLELATVEATLVQLTKQPPYTLLMMRAVEIGLPLLACLLSLLCILRYTLTETRSREIKDLLERRHAEHAAGADPAVV